MKPNIYAICMICFKRYSFYLAPEIAVDPNDLKFCSGKCKKSAIKMGILKAETPT